jgi:hypothetical protein
MSTVSDVADAVQAFATAGGILAGGIFTYYKFIKDRIYRPRLDLKNEYEIVTIDRHEQLLCHLSIHNQGSTKIELVHEGTALVVTPCSVSADPLHTARWSGNDSGTVNVFAAHDWIESNETIRDDALMSLGPEPAYRVEFWLVVGNPAPQRKRNISFLTARVATRKLTEGALMSNTQSQPHDDGQRVETPEPIVDDPAYDQMYEDPEKTKEIEKEKQNP